MKKGFSLIEILIIVAVLIPSVLGGDGLYSMYFKQEEAIVNDNFGDIKTTRELKKLLEEKNKETQAELNK